MPIRPATVLASLVLSLMGGAVVAQDNSLILPTDPAAAVVLQLPDGAATLTDTDMADHLRVFVGDMADCCAGRTPLAGRYMAGEDALRFTPAFPFVEGQDYVVVTEAGTRTAFSMAPETPAIAAGVTEIYPSGDVLPENTLRFYIHFARPMKPHVAFDYIQLLDADGRADDAAFMRFKQELWNADRTRLTLLMDPGRIKREVASNLRLGPALTEGDRFELRIKSGWPTADGRSVLPAYSKRFAVSPALRTLPDPDQWQITPPAPGTTDPLTIRFDRPFDNQLLRKDIRLLADTGGVIEGRITLADNQQMWQFRPTAPWRDGTLRLVVASTLEDVAGNNFKDLLDHTIDTETREIDDLILTIPLSHTRG